MFEDFEYVQSLEKEVDELESVKADFSNEYDLLLHECSSKDIMCAILRSFENIDEYFEMACNYLEKIKECECLEIELSKRNENISQKAYNEISKSFSKLEQHSIALKLALQQGKEQIKYDKAWKQHVSSSFRELDEKYFVVSDLKTQLQDKDIAMSELKKLIEKMKRKYVDTKFEKPLVVRQPNALNFKKHQSWENILLYQILHFQNLGVIYITSVSRPQSTQMKDKVVQNNSQAKSEGSRRSP
ncbi:hypothetical protein Tco_1177801 [Tanacetum coccineum]